MQEELHVMVLKGCCIKSFEPGLLVSFTSVFQVISLQMVLAQRL